jgi:integrase
MLRTAVEWELIERIPCTIKLLKTPKSTASFHDCDEYERLVEATKTDGQAQLVVLLGGEAGLRCGEIMALEWSDVDLNKRHCVWPVRNGKGTLQTQRVAGFGTCR